MTDAQNGPEWTARQRGDIVLVANRGTEADCVALGGEANGEVS